MHEFIVWGLTIHEFIVWVLNIMQELIMSMTTYYARINYEYEDIQCMKYIWAWELTLNEWMDFTTYHAWMDGEDEEAQDEDSW